MKVNVYSTRRVTIENLGGGFVGTRYEQNATTLEFDFSDLNEMEEINNMTKAIHFFDGVLSDEKYIEAIQIENNKCSLNSNITKYEEVKAFIQISKKDFLWKSDVFELKFRQSLNIEPKEECEHVFVEQVEFANTKDVCTRITKTCKNCDEEEIVENPHPSFHIIEEGIFDDVYGCDNKGCPYQYVEPKNRD